MDIATAVVASTASLITTVNMQGTLGEVQGTVLLTWHKCSQATAQGCLHYIDWAIAPASFGPAEAPDLFGAFTVVASFVLLHMMVVCCIKLGQGVLSEALTDGERWDVAAAKCLFPNLSIMCVSFFYQGIIFFTVQNYFKGSSGGYGFSVSFVVGAATILLIAAILYWAITKCVCEYVEYKNFMSQIPRGWLQEKLLMPDAIWNGVPYILRMGTVFYPYRRGRVWFAIIPWIRMCALGIAAAALEKYCSAMFVVCLVVWVLSSLLTLLFRPFRSGLNFLCSTLAHITGLLSCLMGLVHASLPCPAYFGILVLWNIMAIILIKHSHHEQTVRLSKLHRQEQREMGSVPSNPLLVYL